jgi:hypothetical protein
VAELTENHAFVAGMAREDTAALLRRARIHGGTEGVAVAARAVQAAVADALNDEILSLDVGAQTVPRVAAARIDLDMVDGTAVRYDVPDPPASWVIANREPVDFGGRYVTLGGYRIAFVFDVDKWKVTVREPGSDRG